MGLYKSEGFGQVNAKVETGSSGYKGLGFKFSPEEWAEEMEKLTKQQGMDELDAIAELTKREEIVREKQNLNLPKAA